MSIPSLISAGYRMTGWALLLVGGALVLVRLSSGDRATFAAGAMLIASGVMFVGRSMSIRRLLIGVTCLAVALSVLGHEYRKALREQRLLDAARAAVTESGCLIRESAKLRGNVVFVLEGKRLSVGTAQAISGATLVQEVFVFDPVDQPVRATLASAFDAGTAARSPALTVFRRKH